MNNKIVHYTLGYGGKLNYHTLCGKEIHSHSKEETADIDPAEVTCEACKQTDEWKGDYKEATTINPDVKRRIFIESDILADSELGRVKSQVRRLLHDTGATHTKRVFSEVFDYAWHHLDKLWVSVKKADEIYASSSLMPLSGGSYMGAPVIFNGMCERAVAEGITGKDVIILNTLDNINWYMINLPVMVKAFKNNRLLMYDETYSKLIEVNVKEVASKNKR